MQKIKKIATIPGYEYEYGIRSSTFVPTMDDLTIQPENKLYAGRVVPIPFAQKFLRAGGTCLQKDEIRFDFGIFYFSS